MSISNARFVLLTILTLAFARGGSAQTKLTDAEVLAAIQAGEGKKYDGFVSTCTATAGFGEGFAANVAGGLQQNGSYTVVVSGNTGRIASLAANAKRLYKKFAPQDVTDELRSPAVFVAVEPNNPPRDPKVVSVPAPIQQIVLKSKTNPNTVAQPTKIDTEPVEFSNLVGGKFASNRAIATFDLASFLELPSGDVDVVIVTEPGERRCKIGTKDRARLFPLATTK